ncbi:deoxynucleoside triphosphate triphosphohydrolase SAMHD1 isoform X2 [Stomoxys calcitrans]|uniref:deoxynucleoside triphosphate triphosphohydrolase SAMHD1 isoform X2 n=1 Tax=Stomoxys calcitrans TaxID=35570 RepID=UPI0027E2394E|nr:deoxynucleoside triphosphate triphosphohydrolase SAMHD1 isoform X2 [Stomoxys calcitrans]
MDEHNGPEMVIDDPVYGKIYLPQDVAAIVATPHFERLKKIKQLGFLYLDDVKEHTHNRYYHCIGTYHAAGLMLDALEKNTSWLSDNNNTIPPLFRQAVQIAGLVHDIGHGPFSHSWEAVADHYEHEKVGLPCVDEIFACIDEKLFPELRANNNYGICLIKALITGKMKKLHKLGFKLSSKFMFIFGIICNKRNKLDVDKWDYLKRDKFYLKHLCNPTMDFDDIFLKAKVSDCGEYIEYRYNDFGKIHSLFAARWNNHRYCYQLPRNLMRDKILKLIVDEIKPKINGHLLKDIDAKNSMTAFLELTDENILSLVEQHPLSIFLKYDAKFEEVKESSWQVENWLFQTTIDIPSVTSYIQYDSFDFYGDAEDKPDVIDETETIRHIIKFTCDISNDKVFYYIKPVE